MEQKKKKPFLNIYMMLIMFALIPMIVSIVVTCFVLVNDSKSTIKKTTLSYLYDLTEAEGEALADEIALEGPAAALTVENLTEMYAGVGLDDIASSYAYVVSADGTMLFHPTASKIGSSVENSVVKGVVADIQAGRTIKPQVVEYKYKGEMKYAAYFVNETNDFILVISADEKDVMASSNAILKIAIIIAGVLVAIFTVVALVLSKLVADPLKSVAAATDELSKGNVNAPLQAKSHVAEIKTLIGAATTLKTNLNGIVTDINADMDTLNHDMAVVSDAVSTCNEATTGITGAVEELAKGSMEMAESVQNTAASMSEIGVGIEEISALAEEANSNADRVTEISNEAKTNLTQLIEANKSTVEISDEVAKGIMDAGKAVEEISKAAQVITDIATQTNLLSLNASIEAARAGEAGRGFAVVAGEISSLAAQSDSSAKEIQSIIKNIVEKSNQNTELANKIKESVGDEGKVLASVSDSFNKVSECIDVTTENITEIANKATSLDTSKNTVLDEVSTLSSISEENAASTEETNASTEELGANIENINQQTIEIAHVVERVSESIGFFKL